MRPSHALVTTALAVAALVASPSLADAAVSPAGVTSSGQGGVECTARGPYSNGVNVRNTCGHQIAVRVVWSNPSWVTDCWRIDPYLTRPFPKPKPTSQYQSMQACTPR